MRSLILADVHANLEALNAVFADAPSQGGFEEIWCLGDTVGYGPDPSACLELIRSYRFRMVAGNHDFAAVNLRTTADFNQDAQASTEWTAGQLSQEEFQFLAGLPLSTEADPFTLVHGSLRDPLTEYLLDQDSARATFALMNNPHCLVGHSHIPFICREQGGDAEFFEFPCGQPVPMGEERSIINPGGVGQPRDRDSRPSYAIYDSEANTIQRHRVTYDIKETQSKMRRAGLPKFLIDRLDFGY
ncbi:MAG: hypothetical protein BZY88_02655 [SAR202 cluster bacterium Io17-Chloro-G9]|nr:MAG: hypothetical protein BZY88_02655 [SAR202 cluster bacterium Io17-Chloro-G9]